MININGNKILIFRFMADALYILTLRITDKITMIMSEKERNMIETAAFFTSVWYAPWFLKSYLVAKSPSNDLAAFKNAFSIKDKYPNLGSALVASVQRHNWYLTEQLVLLSLADEDVEQEVKKKMLDRLAQYDVPDKFKTGKPKLPVISESTELWELVGPESWLLLKIAKVPDREVELWRKEKALKSLDLFKKFVKNLTCVNDCAERNIRLIQDFVGGHKSDIMQQNLMLVARDNRKKL